MSTLQLVRSCALFYELYDEEIKKIVKSSVVLNLEDGEYVFKKNDVGNEIFLVLNGGAEVKKGEYTIAKLRRGDLFGEMVLLKENVRKADILVPNSADILVIDYAQIFGNYESNAEIFSILMLNLSRMLATRLNKAGLKIEELIIENNQLK